MYKDKQARDRPDLRVGDLVEVSNEAEILATLDDCGELDALPFMPEMLQFCGQRFTVDKVAIKLCDTIDWSGIYRMDNAVHLAGVRCDGQAHGGCQAGCLIYWKEAWLKRVEDEIHEPPHIPPLSPDGRTLLQLTPTGPRSDDPTTYRCQATELRRAASELIPAWDVKQYVLDVHSGNASASTAIRSVSIGAFNKYQDLTRRILPRSLRIRDGRRFPFVIQGRLLRKTPQEKLDLQPGEWVRIKSIEEIVKTLDTTNRNRGMTFDSEMLKYCGRTARVLRRIERIIDEKTGMMQQIRNPCIVLEDVTCTSDYHRLCPRGIYPYWREIWLERVGGEHNGLALG